MKKLIAVEFTVTEEDINNPERQMKIGEKYSYFEDPITKKCYRPSDGFHITGKDLSDRFVEVKRKCDSSK